MKELLISFLICLVIGSIINGIAEQPPQVPHVEEAPENAQEGFAPEPGSDNADKSSGLDNPENKSVSLSTPPDKAMDNASGKQPAIFRVAEVSPTNFDSKVLKSANPVLVEFSQPACQPCQRMSPILRDLARKYEGRAAVYTINLNQSPDIAYKYEVDRTPTFAIFKNGQLIETIVGIQPSRRLAAALDRQL